jgi:hypothetical protein
VKRADTSRASLPRPMPRLGLRDLVLQVSHSIEAEGDQSSICPAASSRPALPHAALPLRWVNLLPTGQIRCDINNDLGPERSVPIHRDTPTAIEIRCAALFTVCSGFPGSFAFREEPRKGHVQRIGTWVALRNAQTVTAQRRVSERRPSIETGRATDGDGVRAIGDRHNVPHPRRRER